MKRIIYLLLLSLFTVGILSPSAFAWWGLPIPPYSHVIDIKRLNDSITVTLKTALEAAQMFEMYEKRFLANTGITSEATQAANFISDLSNQKTNLINGLLGPLNRSLVVTNPSPTTSNVSNSVWKDYKAMTDADLISSTARRNQKANTRAVEENAYKDALALTKNGLAVNQQLLNQIKQVGTMAADGILGQRQAATISQGLITSMQNNAMMNDSAIDAAESTRIKGEVLQSETDERLAKTSALGSFDPYNRTSEDNRLSPKTTPMGFGRF